MSETVRSLAYLCVGILIGQIISLIRDYLAKRLKPKSTRFRVPKTPSDVIIKRSAYVVGGKVKPKYNSDDKALKVEQDKQIGGKNG